MTSERAGSVLLNAPSLTVAGACRATSRELSVRYGVDTASLGTPRPRNENVIGTELPEVLRATTAIVPSVFRKAVRSTPLAGLAAAIRMAPGRTNRL